MLTNALEDPTIIGGKGIELFNTLLKYSYVGLLLTCFILSLGNRPQGSVKGYTLAFIGFAVFTLYMTVRCLPPPVCVPGFLGFLIFFWLRRFASVFFKIKVWSRLLQRATAALRSVSFINAIFRNVAISISATIGLYIVACLIRVSPFSGRGCTPFVKLIDCLVDGSVAYDDFVCTLQTDRFVVVH